MTQINRTALVPFSDKKLFELVADVAAYPEFLPWCGGATVTESSPEHQVATVVIHKGLLHTEFTTRNELTTPKSIRMQLVAGPFRHLRGAWLFTPIGDDACRVEMSMDFEFAGGPLRLLLKPVFLQLCSTLLNAFVQRAHQLHGAA